MLIIFFIALALKHL